MELAPLSWSELTGGQRERLWACGGYADGGVLTGRGFPQWQHDYLDLLMQRDLPNWGLPARAPTTRRLLQMLAATNGQEWNATQIGKSLALSYHTVNSYLDYLEGAFLIRRLLPFHANIRKRIVKRPRVYWRDSGLLHALLGAGELLNQPWVGASWEGFVIDQVFTALRHAGRPFEAFSFRTSDQREIDLVLRVGAELWALEVKLTTRPGLDDLKRLDDAADLIAADRRFLICRRSPWLARDHQVVCDLDGFINFLATAPAGP